MLLDKTGFHSSCCDKSAVDFYYSYYYYYYYIKDIYLYKQTIENAVRLSMFTNHSLIKHFLYSKILKKNLLKYFYYYLTCFIRLDLEKGNEIIFI